jgi:lysophospholipase L1-like esterase
MSETSSPPRAVNTRSTARSKARALLARLALAAGSVLFTLLLLEAATRIFVDPPAPVELRHGLYASQLPKVNGRDTVLLAEGAPLPERKHTGEVRIFVFGESSIQGAPWGYHGSPPALLYDQLHEALPDKDLTVVNMGRGAGYMIDSYYYLASIARFSPDYVVIYQGGNDTYRVDREMCMPANHPVLYRGIRWLMEHSRFAWTARALGPRALLRLRGPRPDVQTDAPPGAVDLCDDTAAFRGWSAILAETAREMGAKVIMTTPVQNPLRWAEGGVAFSHVDMPIEPKAREAEYQRLLACVLTEGCDLVATWNEVRPTAHRGDGYKRDFWGEPRTRAMIEAAREHGAESIDFNAYLEQHAKGGLSPLLFADEVHLTLEGYSQLAWLWASRIGPELGSAPFPALPPPVDQDRYLKEIFAHGGYGGLGGDGRYGRACLLMTWANLYLRANMALLAGSLLEQAVALDAPRPGALPTTRAGLHAKLMIGWLRQLDGLDPELPPALAARLPQVSVAEMTKQLREHGDCSTLGGGEPFPGETTAPGEVDVKIHAIPPGNEAIFLRLLGGAEIAGCALEGATIESTFARATYRCAGGAKATVELMHPDEVREKLASTVKFALVAGDPAPPAALVQGLAERLRAGESAFEWLVVQRADPRSPRPAASDGSRGSRAPFVVGGAALLLALLLLLRSQRRRPSA